MPVRNKDEDFIIENDQDDDIADAGAWAQGLSKGVFAHKKSTSNKRKLKSPRKQSKRKRITDKERSRDESDKYFSECLESRSSIRVSDRVNSYNDIIR